MTNDDSLNVEGSSNELPAPYRGAVQAILEEPVPEVDLARLIPDLGAELARRPDRRAWMVRVGGGLLAGTAAAALVVGLVVMRPAGAWAQVADAIRKQAWVHVVTATPDNGTAESWFSPTKNVAAARVPGLNTLFLDLSQNKLQRYDEKEKTIYTSEPRPGDYYPFVLLDTIFQSMAKGSGLTKGQVSGVKLVAQSRRERQEGDKRWIEHALEFEHPQASPSRFSQVFHVPAGEQLPTRMTQEFVVGGKTVSRVCEIDYPASGPADLLALDVPQDAKVVDLRTNDSLKSLLSEFNQERVKPLGPFSATMLESLSEADWKDVQFARRIRKEGARLHVNHFNEDLMIVRNQIRNGELQIPDGVDRALWWKAEVAKMAVGLSRVYEANSIYEVNNEYNLNPLQAGYVGMSGVSAEGTSRTSRLTLNPRPAVGPSECVMVTAENASTGVKEWVFWFDPSRGHMIVRREDHRRAKPTDWIQTTIIDRAERAPNGRWYVTEYRRGVVEKSGDDLPSRRGVAPNNTWVYRIFVQFDK